ncbi:MAG: NUDIX hydrolase [Muribaculaceae bacterium]|nr:NUDIX hydrolase [Muribaculaceae bacterium]
MEGEYRYKYPHPAVTTDCVVFGFDGIRLNVLLIQRGNEPYKGSWAFPGGFLNIDEDAPDGARRELLEETGLAVTNVEQLGAFATPDRDPRERVISIAYFTLMRTKDVTGGDDAAMAKWFPINKLPELAFDHQQIFEQALERMSHFLKLKTGNFMSSDFTYEEIDMIYYATLTR